MKNKPKKIHGLHPVYRAEGRTLCGRSGEDLPLTTKRSLLTCGRCIQVADSLWTWRDENPNY